MDATHSQPQPEEATTAAVTEKPITKEPLTLLMPLLRQVVSTDEQMQSLAQRNNETGIGPLQQQRMKHIMAVGIALSGITSHLLPAIQRNGQQVSLLRQADEGSLLKAMIVLIGLVNDDMSVPRMSAPQMLNAARFLIKEYWWFKPEEFAYAFQRGSGGAYGKSYNRLDKEILESWCKAYNNGERLDICERGRNLDQATAEEDTRLSIQAVRESYERFANGEPTLQQKRDAIKREQKQKEQQEKNRFFQFKEAYFEQRRKQEEVANDE